MVGLLSVKFQVASFQCKPYLPLSLYPVLYQCMLVQSFQKLNNSCHIICRIYIENQHFFAFLFYLSIFVILLICYRKNLMVINVEIVYQHH